MTSNGPPFGVAFPTSLFRSFAHLPDEPLALSAGGPTIRPSPKRGAYWFRRVAWVRSCMPRMIRWPR